MNNNPQTGKGRAIQWIRDHVGYQGDDCLPWPFSRLNGYGHGSCNGEHFYANRMMCELAHGPAPTLDHEAAHSCGNGHEGCTNPNHLSWKTKTENQLDRATHGRKSAGGRGRLTDAHAAQIRALRGIKPQREIAEMFNTSRANVSLIMTGNLHSEHKVRPGKGYSRDKRSGLYKACIGVNAGSVFLGKFKTESEARAVYLMATEMVRVGLPVHRSMFRNDGATPRRENPD